MSKPTGRPNGRPATVNAKNFVRVLSIEEKMSLAAAGDGDTSIGFRNLLSMFHVLWNKGYRPTMDLNDWIGVGKGDKE